MITLTQHPLSAAFPAMTADEFQAFKDSIFIYGVLNPITLLDGMVLDGWHRYRAATELNMDCPMVELGDIDPRDFVIAQNKARRNMTASQRADAVTSVFQWVASNVGHPRGEDTSPLVKTNAEMAEIADTTTRTIQHAKAMQAGADPAIQAAVRAGTVSVDTAAAMARLPAETQRTLAIQGPDAMREATKANRKSGTSDRRIRSASGINSTSPDDRTPPAGINSISAAPALTAKEVEVAKNAQDAYGDIDPVEMWEAALKEVVILQKELDAAQADDQKAEIIKWRRIADAANRRQDELMDTVNQRERELRRMANWLRRIGAALCEPDNSKLPALVEALARTAKAKAQTPDKPVLLAEHFHGDPANQRSSTYLEHVPNLLPSLPNLTSGRSSDDSARLEHLCRPA